VWTVHYYFTPAGCRSLQSACVCICLSVPSHNNMSKLQNVLCTTYFVPQPSRGSSMQLRRGQACARLPTMHASTRKTARILQQRRPAGNRKGLIGGAKLCDTTVTRSCNTFTRRNIISDTFHAPDLLRGLFIHGLTPLLAAVSVSLPFYHRAQCVNET